MKVLGLAVIAVLVIGAFASIPNVAAIGEFTQAKGTSHLTFGSASGKVCGAELCGAKSMTPPVRVELKENVVLPTKANMALQKALQGSEAAEIIANYNQFQGISTLVIDESEQPIVSDFNAYANPTFYNPVKVKDTFVKAPEMTIEEKKQAQVDAVKANFPNYIRESYANADHPVYVPKVKSVIIENVTSSEIILEQNIISSNMTDSSDLILFNLGFDIDMTKIGVCGPGTELIDGICFISTDETVNNDWADFWDTKEDKEVVLEQVIMTNGTDTIPLVDDMVVEGEVVIIEEVVEESVVIEEIKQEIILETMTIVVDGKTFKSQESADRYLESLGPAGSTGPTGTVIEVIPEVEPSDIVEEVNPRLNTNNSTESNDSGFDTTALK